MISILFKYIYFFFQSLARHIYWVGRLSKIKFGKGLKVEYPVIVEGSGPITIGNNSLLSKECVLAVSRTSSLWAGENFCMNRNVAIKIGGKGKLTVGNNLSIDNSSRIYINESWAWRDDIKIATHCQIFSREKGYFGKLNIGDGTHIGDNTIIDVSGNIEIGNEVAIGPNCVIYTHDHVYNAEGMASWKGGETIGNVVIEDGVWIASGVTIMPGITIGTHAVVAAGAVVTKDIEPRTVNAGIPARKIKSVNA